MSASGGKTSPVRRLQWPKANNEAAARPRSPKPKSRSPRQPLQSRTNPSRSLGNSCHARLLADRPHRRLRVRNAVEGSGSMPIILPKLCLPCPTSSTSFTRPVVDDGLVDGQAHLDFEAKAAARSSRPDGRFSPSSAEASCAGRVRNPANRKLAGPLPARVAEYPSPDWGLRLWVVDRGPAFRGAANVYTSKAMGALLDPPQPRRAGLTPGRAGRPDPGSRSCPAPRL
jgi:hypothetical protein